jgi:hypothetical protein
MRTSSGEGIRHLDHPWGTLEVNLEPILDLTNGRIRRVLRVSGVRMLAGPSWALQDQGEDALTVLLCHCMPLDTQPLCVR